MPIGRSLFCQLGVSTPRHPLALRYRLAACSLLALSCLSATPSFAQDDGSSSRSAASAAESDSPRAESDAPTTESASATRASSATGSTSGTATSSPFRESRSSAPSSDPAAFAQIRLRMGMGTEIADYRQGLKGQLPGFLPPSELRSGGSISVQTTDFDIRVLAMEFEQGFGFFTAKIPIRNLKYVKDPRNLTATGKTQSQGSEFGGYFAGMDLNFYHFFEVLAGYRDLRSDRLQLIEPVAYLSAYGSVAQSQNLTDTLALSYKLWGEILAPKNKSPWIQYGKQNTAGLDLGLEVLTLGTAVFKAGAALQVTRIDSYKLAGSNLGGGGLGTLSPYVQYALSSSIVLEARYDNTLFRPIGREEIFGETSVPGLFGNIFSFSVALR